MNNSFAKTAVAAGVVAAMGYGQEAAALSNPPSTSDVVVLGCSVPSAGTTVATVYSVDAVSNANSTYTISLPTAVAVGQSCSAAIAALGSSSANSSVYFALASSTPVNQAIPGTGYSLQQFTFTGTNTAGTAAAQGATGFIGCSAPGNTGATVYSVDAGNQTNATNYDNLNALSGKPCSYALSKATNSAYFSATSIPTPVVLNINSNGYSLVQYSFQ